MLENEKGSGEKRRKEQMDQLITGAPIDFSFRNLATLRDLQNERPRALRVGRAPKRGFSKKFLTRSIWLNNNNLESFDGFDDFIKDYLEVPSELGWVDLSLNNLTEIDDVIVKYSKIKILYLHGNNISSLEKLNKLSTLTQLRSLTLHGNPIEAFSNYRAYIVHTLPQIINLDFSPVVPSERTAVYRNVKVTPT